VNDTPQIVGVEPYTARGFQVRPSSSAARAAELPGRVRRLLQGQATARTNEKGTPFLEAIQAPRAKRNRRVACQRRIAQAALIGEKNRKKGVAQAPEYR
jgi:hypothetical protein